MTTTHRYKCPSWQTFAASAYLHIARSTAQTGGALIWSAWEVARG